MKRTLSFLILFSLLLPSLSAQKLCRNIIPQRVISTNGLNLRQSPNLNSKIITTIPFWAKTEVCLNREIPDTINSYFGYWRKAQYDNHEGYLFDGFTINIDTSYQSQHDFRIMEEGAPCASPNYDPELHWYGVFRQDGVDSLLAVKVSLTRFKIGNDGQRYEGGDLLVMSDRSKEPGDALFLLGSLKPLKEGIVGYERTVAPHVLYPGQTYGLYTQPSSTTKYSSLQLNAIGTVKDIKGCPDFENYRLRLTYPHDNYKTQDLTDDFALKGECGMVKLQWFGDIDGDHIPDLLFKASTDAQYQISLFLSSEADKADFVKMVSHWTAGNCY